MRREAPQTRGDLIQGSQGVNWHPVPKKSRAAFSTLTSYGDWRTITDIAGEPSPAESPARLMATGDPLNLIRLEPAEGAASEARIRPPDIPAEPN
jgi:hypothetical protein